MKNSSILRVVTFVACVLLILPAKADGALKNAEVDPFGQHGVLGHFTWGVDVGSNVDMTAHDMTCFEISSCFGYKNPFFRFLGVGASIESMMNNPSYSYPIYVMVRTSFSQRHKPCFLDLRVGMAINTIGDFKEEIDPYGSLGVGFTLAHSRKFTSHVILRGIYQPLKKIYFEDGAAARTYSLAFASVTLGCAF